MVLFCECSFYSAVLFQNEYFVFLLLFFFRYFNPYIRRLAPRSHSCFFRLSVCLSWYHICYCLLIVLRAFISVLIFFSMLIFNSSLSSFLTRSFYSIFAITRGTSSLLFVFFSVIDVSFVCYSYLISYASLVLELELVSSSSSKI